VKTVDQLDEFFCPTYVIFSKLKCDQGVSG